MNERILIRDRIITKIDAVKMEKGHFRRETNWDKTRQQALSPRAYYSICKLSSQNRTACADNLHMALPGEEWILSLCPKAKDIFPVLDCTCKNGIGINYQIFQNIQQPKPILFRIP